VHRTFLQFRDEDEGRCRRRSSSTPPAFTNAITMDGAPPTDAFTEMEKEKERKKEKKKKKKEKEKGEEEDEGDNWGDWGEKDEQTDTPISSLAPRLPRGVDDGAMSKGTEAEGDKNEEQSESWAEEGRDMSEAEASERAAVLMFLGSEKGGGPAGNAKG